ncbi:MAG: hypothetical protein ACLU2Y_14630 [Blautia massiliensis (ex Durand et al. 2017)]|uniref:hypothetical protein n=1 Tax=Blautia massiliensis (ex Durand et al. 2017) TaxID=1737424 RepID=UPI00399C51F1
MKKGKKIVIGVAAVAVVAGGIYAAAGAGRGEITDSAGFSYQRRRPEMWKKSWTQPEPLSVMNRRPFIHR